MDVTDKCPRCFFRLTDKSDIARHRLAERSLGSLYIPCPFHDGGTRVFSLEGFNDLSPGRIGFCSRLNDNCVRLCPWIARYI